MYSPCKNGSIVFWLEKNITPETTILPSNSITSLFSSSVLNSSLKCSKDLVILKVCVLEYSLGFH